MTADTVPDLDELERLLAEAREAMELAEDDEPVPMAEVWQPRAQIELYFAAADALPALIQRLRNAEAKLRKEAPQ